jgi:ELWxxDGT repeat protein
VGNEPRTLDLQTGAVALVADIRVGPGSSSPQQPALIAGQAVFSADDGVSGRELWRTVNSVAGVVSVDVNPGSGSSFPSQFVAAEVGGTPVLFFSANDGTAGIELHRLDISGRTTYDLNPGSGNSAPADLAVTDAGALYGRASDGTTTQVLRIAAPSATPATDTPELIPLDGRAQHLSVNGDVAFAMTNDGFTSNGDLTVFPDASSAGMVVAEDTKGDDLMAAGQGAVVHGFDADLGTSFVGVYDGVGYSRVVSDATSASLLDEEGAGGFGILQVGTAGEGREPWVSIGTGASTVLLSDIFPGPASSDPVGVRRDPAGDVVFLADDGVNGYQIWQSDGSTAGTQRLTTSSDQQTLDSDPEYFVRVGDATVFVAETQSTGSELWIRRTPGGPVELVVDLVPGPNGSDPSDLVVVGGTVFFEAENADGEDVVGATDGTEAGTVVSVLNVFTLRPAGGTLVTSSDGVLLKWNGATEVFEPLGTLTDVGTSPSPVANGRILVGGCLSSVCGVYGVDVATGAAELIAAGDDPGVIDSGASGGQIFARLRRDISGTPTAWYRSDGTTAGSFVIADLGATVSRDVWSLDDGGVIAVNRSNTGDYTFYRVDVDGEVTTLANPPGEAISDVTEPSESPAGVGFDGGVLAILDRGAGGAASLVAAGAESTSALAVIRPSGIEVLYESPTSEVLWADVSDGEVVFLVEESDGNDRMMLPSPPVSQLWASDGTVGGTRLEYDFADDDLANPYSPRLLGDELWLRADSPLVGEEPFVIDLTSPDEPEEPEEPGEVPELVSLDPARVLDTRATGETVDDRFEKVGRMLADDIIELDVAGRAGVPDDAASVVLNLTMIRPDSNGFMTLYPCGMRPNASLMNAPASGGVVANEVVAKLSDAGTVCVYTSVGTHVAADVTGYAPAGSEYEALKPARLLDSRDGKQTADGEFAEVGRMAADDVIELEVLDRGGVPAAGVGSVVLNVTMIRPDGNGFMTIYPCGDRPLASSINAPRGGGVVANEVIAKVSDVGTVCIYSSVGTHVAADVAGYVPVGTGITSLDPRRLLDTRDTGETADGLFERLGRLDADDMVELDVLGRGGVPTTGVGAVVLNVTMIRPDANGFVTTYPCGDRPLASSLNAPADGGVAANELIAKVSAAGTVCLYTSVATNLAADVTGYVAA